MAIAPDAQARHDAGTHGVLQEEQAHPEGYEPLEIEADWHDFQAGSGNGTHAVAGDSNEWGSSDDEAAAEADEILKGSSQAWTVSFQPLDAHADPEGAAAARAAYEAEEGFAGEQTSFAVEQPAAAHPASADRRSCSGGDRPVQDQPVQAASSSNAAAPASSSSFRDEPMTEEHRRAILGAMKNVKLDYAPRWAAFLPEDKWGLSKLLADHAGACLREQKFENYFGRKIAIDASMHIYQFLVVVGRTGDQTLTDEAGEVTSHLQGMFYRTARMLESGMKPVYVFDGKPPELKREELGRRHARHGEATDNLEEAKETGTAEDVAKYSKRTVRVTKQHNDDCKQLLHLMGVPVIEAPSEAESQCAAMCKEGAVYAIATEDMDALTFATPRLVRNMMKPASAKDPINEYEYAKVLQGLELTQDQFVDMCILCGCDYCGTIKGIGAVRALQLIRQHGGLKEVLASLDPAKYQVPDPFPYEEAQRLFKEPTVTPSSQLPPLKWNAADEEGLVAFLVKEKNFNEDRVRKGVQKINKSRDKSGQGRLESFFGAATTKSSSTGKRKEPEPKAKGGKAKGKAGGLGKKTKAAGAQKSKQSEPEKEEVAAAEQDDD